MMVGVGGSRMAKKVMKKLIDGPILPCFSHQICVQWNLDLVTDLVTPKSVLKSWVVPKSMYFVYEKTSLVLLKRVTKSRLSLNL